MKILMSAYACCPGHGSEEGVGWNWAVGAARTGHEVTVVTQGANRDAIEAQQAGGMLPGSLSFHYLMPSWLGLVSRLLRGIGLRGVADLLTHLLWQVAAYAELRKRVRPEAFDVVHHITYGGIRHSTLLGLLPVPLVLGPVGGGDRVPYPLRSGFGLSGWWRELVRDVHTWCLRFDPITQCAIRRALVVYAKTDATRQLLPERFRQKTDIRMEIGIRAAGQAKARSRKTGSPLKLIYAGRLIELKGMQVGLRALALARRNGIDARLTMIGTGPDEQKWRRLAKSLDIGDAVTWTGQVPHSRMHAMYRDHDALLFPSMRDSSGNVVLEALAAGLPVLCLDLGGPGELVTRSCGRAVPVAGADEAACAARLAAAIAELASEPDTFNALSAGALERARHFVWSEVIGNFYSDVEQRLKSRFGARQAGRVARATASPAARQYPS